MVHSYHSPGACNEVLQPLALAAETCHTNSMKKEAMNNLYILTGVLADYTDGMAVIAAPSLERAWEVFGEDDRFHIDLEHEKLSCWEIKVIEGVNHAEGVVSYMYGGG